MSQPTDRFTEVDAYGAVDDARREFWVRNPWDFPADKNLSGYEANQVHWNAGDFAFHNISYVSGIGDRGDGRAALFGDLDGDFVPDLVLRQASLGPLKIYGNRWPNGGRRVIIQLEGTKSNRMGIGTRVVAHVGEQVITRELFPANNFHGQQPARVNIGVGSAETIDRLILHWPSGTKDEYRDVGTNRFLRLREGASRDD